MISIGDITKELLVSTPTGVYIQLIRKEDTHMLRHIWVTPKQFCELTKLSMDEAIKNNYVDKLAVRASRI